MELAKTTPSAGTSETVEPPPPQEVEVTEEDLQAAREEGEAILSSLQADNAHVWGQIALLTQQSFSALYEQVKVPDDLERGEKPPPPFGTKHYSACGAYCIAAIRTEAKLRVAQTVLAIERYSQRHNMLPETLEAVAAYCVTPEALIDPYNDEYLNYQVDEDKFIVYSVGDKLLNEDKHRLRPGAPSGISFTVHR